MNWKISNIFVGVLNCIVLIECNFDCKLQIYFVLAKLARRFSFFSTYLTFCFSFKTIRPCKQNDL